MVVAEVPGEGMGQTNAWWKADLNFVEVGGKAKVFNSLMPQRLQMEISRKPW